MSPKSSIYLLPLFLAVFLSTQCQPAGSAPARKVSRPASPKAKSQLKPQAASNKKTVDLTGPYTSYIERLRQKVLPNWDFPPGKFRVILTTTVNSDGSSAEPTLSSTPHSDAAERAASSAFAQAQPLEGLPAQSTPTCRITMTFDSSYDPHGDSSSNLSARIDPIAPPAGAQSPTQAATPAQAAPQTTGDNQAPADNASP